METATSISGGMTSAYVALNYPSEHNWFALVTTTDPSCAFTDPAAVEYVQTKTDTEVVGTLEDDVIIYTIMDLEQYMGRSIDIVLGEPFDSVIDAKGSYLPNVMTRYCTTEMKIRPLFRHWSATCDEPVEMQIGFRANEQRRAQNMEKKVNADGLLEFKDIVGKWPSGRNRWQTTAWQKPSFPLIRDGIFKDYIEDFWRDKPVRFATLNNCVGCFHRNPILLRQMFDDHPEKMAWFEAQEQRSTKGQWKKEMSYTKIKNHRLQLEIDPADWESDCDSGHCGL